MKYYYIKIHRGSHDTEIVFKALRKHFPNLSWDVQACPDDATGSSDLPLYKAMCSGSITPEELFSANKGEVTIRYEDTVMEVF